MMERSTQKIVPTVPLVAHQIFHSLSPPPHLGRKNRIVKRGSKPTISSSPILLFYTTSNIGTFFLSAVFLSIYIYFSSTLSSSPSNAVSNHDLIRTSNSSSTSANISSVYPPSSSDENLPNRVIVRDTVGQTLCSSICNFLVTHRYVCNRDRSNITSHNESSLHRAVVCHSNLTRRPASTEYGSDIIVAMVGCDGAWIGRQNEDDEVYIDLPVSLKHPLLSSKVMATIFPAAPAFQFNSTDLKCGNEIWKKMTSRYHHLKMKKRLMERILHITEYTSRVNGTFSKDVTIDMMMDAAEKLEEKLVIEKHS